jgi:hypothetical protein
MPDIRRALKATAAVCFMGYLSRKPGFLPFD